MYVVKCIDRGNTNSLVRGEQYYAFPLGNGAAYISRFPRREAHFGCYNLKYFEEVPQTNTGKAVYEYHYFVYAINKKLRVYGFDATEKLIAIYRDKELLQYIGSVPSELCEKEVKISEKSNFSTYSLIKTGLRMGDLENIEIVGGKVQEQQFEEQMSLF